MYSFTSLKARRRAEEGLQIGNEEEEEDEEDEEEEGRMCILLESLAQ